jgi:endonuclease/exonuclease/phosphatase family metal-dependent hydrolase
VGWSFGQTNLKIVASNVTSGNYQSYQTAGINILKALAPDVALMQEFNVNTVSGGANDDAAVTAFVNSTFGNGFYWYREPMSAGIQIPNGVVSRYPIISSGKLTDTQVTNRSLVWARIDVPGPNDLFAISVHLLTSGSSVRNTQAQEIVNTLIPSLNMPAGSYLVLGGDFNTDTRTESCISTLTSQFVTASPYPVGQDGTGNTNSTRSKPYDWVLANSALNALKTTTTYGSFSYTNGLVFDTRDFTQTQLDASFSPTKVANSNDSNMQHMAVVRTFTLPPTTPVTGGNTATVSTTPRVASTAQVGNTAPMLSVDISTAANEWDLGSMQLNLQGTAAANTVTAKVYNDANNNGAVDAGESLLGSGNFAGGTTNITLSPAPRATPGTPIHALAVLSILNTATSGSTVQLQLTANGLVHSNSGGADVDPTVSTASSGFTTIVSAPTTPVVSGSSVVINKYTNAATDAVELLVVQDHLDMRGMILKDYSSSMANDNGKPFIFTTNALWSDVRAGTLIVLRNDNSAADTNASDSSLDLGLTNTTYFTAGNANTFDIATVEMLMIKAAGSGIAGSAGSIHALAGGAAGTQYTNTTNTAKLRALTGTSTGQFVIVDNQTTQPGNNSVLSNFYDGSGLAYGGVTTATLGAANGPANQDFITFLRGTSPIAATSITGSGFQANWNSLVTAAGYQLDVATDAAFSNPVPGYYNVDVSGTSSMVTGLNPTTTYYYRVRGVNVEGTPSASSNGISATTTTSSGIQDWSLYSH